MRGVASRKPVSSLSFRPRLIAVPNATQFTGSGETVTSTLSSWLRYSGRPCKENARRNGLADRFSVVCGDLRQAHAQIPAGSFDFAVSNPPYYPPGSGRLRKEDSLSLARSELCCPLDALCAAAARALRWGGRLYLVHKPERLADLMVFLRAARLEPKRLRFVRHSAASAVSLVLLEARLGGKPGLQIEPELVLYGPDGSESAACRRIYHRQE